MKWTDYATNGYHYDDYLKLSQWQRWLYIWTRISGQKNLRVLGVTFMLRAGTPWRWGFTQSQEWDALELGPITIWGAP